MFDKITTVQNRKQMNVLIPYYNGPEEPDVQLGTI